jgi:hypothetical protein
LHVRGPPQAVLRAGGAVDDVSDSSLCAKLRFKGWPGSAEVYFDA